LFSATWFQSHFLSLKTAPVFFRIDDNGELEANVVTGQSEPVVVPLPRYDDVVEGARYDDVVEGTRYNET